MAYATPTLTTLLLAGLLSLASCTGGEPAIDYSTCYYGATDRDTTALSYNPEGDQVRGEMRVRYFQMEPQEGRLKGFWRGDTLMGEFRYRENGQDITREIFFLRKPDGTLTEGFGERHMADGKLVYVQSQFLHFDHVHQLSPRDCQ